MSVSFSTSPFSLVSHLEMHDPSSGEWCQDLKKQVLPSKKERKKEKERK